MPIVTLANGRSFTAERGVSILDAALAAGLVLKHSCRTGRCGSCQAQVLGGYTNALRDEPSLSAEAVATGSILTCVREAETDITLDAEDLSALAGIKPKTLPCRISAIALAAPDVIKVELRLPSNAGFAFRAGQYLDISGPGGLRRSYSIASDMHRPDRVELHVRRVDGGVMSAYWFEAARAEDLLRFRGPLGTFFLRDVSGLALVFLTTGTGYSPVQSMLHQLAAMEPASQPASVDVLWGGRVLADLYANLPECGELNVAFTPVLSRAGAEWSGARGHVQDVLLKRLPQLERTAVYACGSDAMIHAARIVLTAAGLPAKRFYSDAFVSSN